MDDRMHREKEERSDFRIFIYIIFVHDIFWSTLGMDGACYRRLTAFSSGEESSTSLFRIQHLHIIHPSIVGLEITHTDLSSLFIEAFSA